jgi:hypothetical protein
LRGDLLSQFKGKKLHQGLEKLHLHAWLLSGRLSDREAFLKKQPSENGLATILSHLVQNPVEKTKWWEDVIEHLFPGVVASTAQAFWSGIGDTNVLIFRIRGELTPFLYIFYEEKFCCYATVSRQC